MPATPADSDPALVAIEGWLDIFSKWHGDLRLAPGERPDGKRVSHWFLGVYGLVATFETSLDNIADAAWKKLKTTLPENLEEEQLIGLETGVQKTLRTKFFSGIRERLRLAAGATPGDDSARRFSAGIAVVERYAGLLEVNLNDAAAMESLLLQLLRVETARD